MRKDKPAPCSVRIWFLRLPTPVSAVHRDWETAHRCKRRHRRLGTRRPILHTNNCRNWHRLGIAGGECEGSPKGNSSPAFYRIAEESSLRPRAGCITRAIHFPAGSRGLHPATFPPPCSPILVCELSSLFLFAQQEGEDGFFVEM